MDSMASIAATLKTPLHMTTSGLLGDWMLDGIELRSSNHLIERVEAVATVALYAVGMAFSVPLWIVGEVIELSTEEGQRRFIDDVDLGDDYDVEAVFRDPAGARVACLDKSKTQFVGTGLSTFQATSDPEFCSGTSVHEAVKDPALGLGKGVDILTEEGRDLTLRRLIDMKANTFRFSIEWADVQKNGLDKYIAAAQAFHDADFKLIITLDHWIGNGDVAVFENDEDIDAFVEYAKDAYEALRPYTSHFLTFNEPNVDGAQKHVMGDLPPRGTANFWAAKRLVTQKLLAHRRAYDALHALERTYEGEKAEGELKVGLTHQAIRMRSDSRWNLIARVVSFVMTYTFHESFMTIAERMKDKLDFIGIQYYTRPLAGVSGWMPVDSIAQKNKYNPFCWMVDAMRYRFDPQGILPILHEINKRIGKPSVVTEIGSAGRIDPRSIDPSVESMEHRKAVYYNIAMRAMRVAQDQGVMLIGALFWTLYGNLEWQHGYKPGNDFGIMARDPETGKERITAGYSVLADAFFRSIPRSSFEVAASA